MGQPINHFNIINYYYQQSVHQVVLNYFNIINNQCSNSQLSQWYHLSIISAPSCSHLTSVSPSCVRLSICNCQLWKHNLFTVLIFWRLTWTLLILSHRDSGGLRIAPATPQDNPSMTTWCSPTQYCLSSTQYCALPHLVQALRHSEWKSAEIQRSGISKSPHHNYRNSCHP